MKESIPGKKTPNHVFDMTGFPALLCTAVFVLVSAGGCGTKPEAKKIFKSPSVNIKLAKLESSGQKDFKHPWRPDPGLLDALLDSIHYKYRALLNKPQIHSAFPKKSRKKLIQPLMKAFAAAGPDEVVDFYFVYPTEGVQVFQRELVTNGIMFIKNGYFNCAFRNIAYESTDDPRINRSPFFGDPTRKPFPARWALIPGKGQKLVTGGSSNILASDIFTNWIQIDLSAQWCLWKKPLPTGPAARTMAEDSGKSSQKPPHTDADASEKTEMENQLKFLDELYREGAVSDSDYQKKREEILKDYPKALFKDAGYNIGN